jgi:hypothetical protein
MRRLLHGRLKGSPLDSPLHILQHALGVDRYGQGRQYRSHFVTGHGCADYEACCALTAAGLMRDAGASELTGGDTCFVVTRAGVDFVAANSPPRPPEPKLTRSQKRYRQYLDADLGVSFRQWIGAHG